MKKILVFLLTIVVLSVCSCRSSKTDTTVHQDNTEQKQTEQEEVSTDKAQVDVNKNVERIIEMMQQMEFNWQKTNYSPPDSTGKQAQAGVSIGGLSESVGGASTPNDFETLMQLIYLRFEKPRFDKEVHNTMMQRNYAAIENSANNPQKIMQDSVSMIMSNYSPRTLLFGKEFLDKVSIEQIEEIYRSLESPL